MNRVLLNDQYHKIVSDQTKELDLVLNSDKIDGALYDTKIIGTIHLTISGNQINDFLMELKTLIDKYKI